MPKSNILAASTKTIHPKNTLAGIPLYVFGLLFGLSFAGLVIAELKVRDVSAAEAATILMEDPEIGILDVRTGFEFDRGHLEGAVNLNYYSRKFKSKLDELDKEKTWLVHCRSGVRSGKTLPLMEAAGFKSVIHLKDGIVDWVNADLPVVK